MNVRELRYKLAHLDEDMEVVVVGHFGEAIRVDASEFRIEPGPNRLVDGGWDDGGDETGDVFCIPDVDIGPDPC
jgi:hypothetical protein